jgi:hypothetical protein
LSRAFSKKAPQVAASSVPVNGPGRHVWISFPTRKSGKIKMAFFLNPALYRGVFR